VPRRVPAPALVIGAAVSVQGGAAVAKSMFGELGPPGVVLLRLLFGGAAVWLVQRPRLRGRERGSLRLALLLGLTLVCMNLSFWEALDRLPLGVVVTVEFLGPLAVAVVTSRGRFDLVWIVLAGAGVALLARGGGAVEPLGIGLAALAGFFWAVYIVLGVRVGRAWAGASGLAIAMAFACVIALPWGAVSGGANLFDPTLLAEGAAVGVLSSALPWSLEIEALRRLPTHVFGVLMSLEPGVAAVAGLALLGEHLRGRQIVAIALVVVASAGAARRAPKPELPPDA
jgi:inner membrane transporter RhtA